MSERELASHLARVEAPEELWRRIQEPRRIGRRFASPLLAAASVFLVSMVSAAWYVSRAAPGPIVKPVISRSGACATCHLS